MLCEQVDVERRIQTTFTANPDPTVAALIVAAQARIESYVGRPLESATRTAETYDPPAGAWPIRLRHWPVTGITTVTVDGVALTVPDDIIFYPDGRLVRVASGLPRWWATTKRQSIVVTYTGGYLAGTHDLELDLFRDVCAWMVARAFETGRAIAEQAGALAGVASESIGDYTIAYAPTAGLDLTDHLSISAEFKTDLARYRSLVVA